MAVQKTGASGSDASGWQDGTPYGDRTPNPFFDRPEPAAVPRRRSGSHDDRPGNSIAAAGGRAEARRSRQRGGDGPSDPAESGRAARRKQSTKKPRKRGMRFIAYTTAGALVVAVGVGGYIYTKLSGNIKSSPLYAGTDGDAGHETPDAFGRTPINILVIGSDSRENADDCAIGGVCGPGANADVQMLLHVSADRTNATVMSIPRDTITDLPACTDAESKRSMKARRGQINSTLDYGPGCTVAAVHKLTDIPIDHFITVDFTGVVQMSDAVGGVPVCVTDDVYDPDSHLKLSKGTHTLKGMAALQFVRTRHGFGDGSDLGRAAAQHSYIGSMIRELKSAGTLANPTKVLSLANAATKALTVDTELDSVTKLVGLANDLNKVQPNRITFTTMQNTPDPANDARVLVAPAAKNLFKAIAGDQSLTNSDGAKSDAAAEATAKADDPGTSTAAPSAGAAREEIVVHVKNGSGITNRAGAVADALKSSGFNPATTGSTGAAATTSSVTYTAGRQADAQEVAAAVGLPASAVKPGSGSGISLVIGADWPKGTTFSGSAATAAPSVDPQKALSNADASTADDKSSCTKVSPFRTVKLKGVPMTPTQAYARSTDVADSAR